MRKISAESDSYNQRILASSVSRHQLGDFEAPTTLDAAVDVAGLVWEIAAAVEISILAGQKQRVIN